MSKLLHPLCHIVFLACTEFCVGCKYFEWNCSGRLVCSRNETAVKKDEIKVKLYFFNILRFVYNKLININNTQQTCNNNISKNNSYIGSLIIYKKKNSLKKNIYWSQLDWLYVDIRKFHIWMVNNESKFPNIKIYLNANVFKTSAYIILDYLYLSWFALFFNGVSTFMRYLIPKPSL